MDNDERVAVAFFDDVKCKFHRLCYDEWYRDIDERANLAAAIRFCVSAWARPLEVVIVRTTLYFHKTYAPMFCVHLVDGCILDKHALQKMLARKNIWKSSLNAQSDLVMTLSTSTCAQSARHDFAECAIEFFTRAGVRASVPRAPRVVRAVLQEFYDDVREYLAVNASDRGALFTRQFLCKFLGERLTPEIAPPALVDTALAAD